MTVLDPREARLHAIEERLTRMEERMVTKADLAALGAELAAIKGRVESLPTKWMAWVFVFGVGVPIYGILVTLLWTTVHH